jgi:hypothetical protein
MLKSGFGKIDHVRCIVCLAMKGKEVIWVLNWTSLKNMKEKQK